MSAHGYYSIDKDKIKHMSFFKNGSHNKIRNGWIYKNGVYLHVWSGASVVSYYDGDTLLGVEEVDEGEDVLHPSIDTTKSGYTLVGWSTEPNNLNKMVTSLPATGEEMQIYALYLPDSIIVVSGSVVGTSDYILYSRNSLYVNGNCGNHDARAGYYVGPGTISSGFNIDVQMGFYQNGTLNFTLNNEAPFDESTSYMGSPISTGSHSVQINASGNYYGSTRGSVDWHTSGGTAGGVTSLVLRNPKAWV